MKTKGMAHQLEARRRARGKAFFGYFMEQGTGKTWTILDEAEELFTKDKIDALLVIAPNGVHRNWVKREIPTHLSVPHIAHAWFSGAGSRELRHINELMQEPRQRMLKIFSINIDALIHKQGLNFTKGFCMRNRTMIAVDESSRIKNPRAKRTEAVMSLAPLSVVRRIASGTPITNSPIDAFAQFEFMRRGLLGTSSYRAFVAEYAEVLPPTHPLVANLIRKNPRTAHMQMIAQNEDGSPRWKNLDKLKALIAPHTYRVLKEDCLDLPPKIYKQHSFQLTPKQRKAYEFMAEACRVELGVETVELLGEAVEVADVITVKQQAVLMKLQQITSGFVKLPDGTIHYVEEENGRLNALMEIVEDIDGKFIVWARFKEEIASISRLLNAEGYKVVEYHGDVSKADREIAIDSFQSGDARIFIGQAQSGGIGLTLTAADTAIYFSKDFSLETRLQSEDRNHRIGTTRPVVYIDIIADDTMDEAIMRGLRRKAGTAAGVLGDHRKQATR